MSLTHLAIPGSGSATTVWPVPLRRPPAYVDQPTVPALPTRPTPPAAPATVVVDSIDLEWDVLDLLLLPIALYLAAAPSRPARHRRAPGHDPRSYAGRTIRSHRAPVGAR